MAASALITDFWRAIAEPFDLPLFDLPFELLETSLKDDEDIVMHTLNAIANETYYDVTSSQDSWPCATNASMTHLPTALPTGGFQEASQPCSDGSLTTSDECSPALQVEDFFPSLATASSNTQSPSEVRSSTAKHHTRSPSSTGRSSDDKGCKVQKRQRNTEAARRYRQRKVDKVDELEEALHVMTKERDDLRLRLARSEAEAAVLRGLVGRRD